MDLRKFVIGCFLVVATALFGISGKATADAITVGTATANTDIQGKIYIPGKGTFSVNDGRRLVSITMKVRKLDGTLVSATPSTNPMGTTEWGSNSDHTMLRGTTYVVTAEITTKNNDGSDETTIPSQNSVQVTP